MIVRNLNIFYGCVEIKMQSYGNSMVIVHFPLPFPKSFLSFFVHESIFIVFHTHF